MPEVPLVLFVQESPCLPVGLASKPPFEGTVRARHYNLGLIIVVGSLNHIYIYVRARARVCVYGTYCRSADVGGSSCRNCWPQHSTGGWHSVVEFD